MLTKCRCCLFFTEKIKRSLPVKKKQRYKTDLNDEQWKLVSRYLPQSKGPGRRPKYDMREIINAILYVVHTGCQWAMIPHDFPPWYSVYDRFNKWRKDRTRFLIHQILHQQLRKHVGKEPEPTAAITPLSSRTTFTSPDKTT
ncbi:MAG: transposase [Candidatus Electrothrix sp. LOE2]|nr:transposase [Candidatus Electrothrix sp. LOE2]